MSTVQPRNDSGLELHVPRPGFGTAGKKAKVAVNSYAVTKFPSATVHQYDVSIGKGDEKRALLKKIWHSEQVQKMFGPAANTLLYDGNKLAWSIVPLPFGEQWTGMIDLDEGSARPPRPGRENKHRIVIKKTGKVPLQITEAYVKGTYKLDNDVLVGINFLDHLLRETPSKHFITIKRSFFQSQGNQPLDGGVEAWKGIFQSIRVVQGGRLTVNVDVATAVFWSEGNLLTNVQRMMKLGSPEDLVNKLKNPAGMRDLRRIKKVQFYITHRGDAGKSKIHTVEGFGKTANDTFFELYKKGQEHEEGKGEQISIAQYYYKTYNIRLRYPQLPLILTKKKAVIFPMELCFVQKGQRYPFKLDDRQTADMIKFTVQRPSVRSDAIKRNVEMMEWRKDPILAKYGLEINTNMIQTDARILPAPKLNYGAGSQDANFIPRDGRWDLRGKKFAKTAQLKSWGIMVCADPRRVPEAMVQNFVRQFITSYTGHGGQVLNKEPPIMYMNASRSIGTSVRELYNATGNKVNSKPQILFFVLTMKSTQPYNSIKAFCDTDLGVVSQCVQSKHVEQAKAQYCSNVCMKVNAKLGGKSVDLDKTCHPMWEQNATIFIGADVSHGGSFGGGGMKSASFASMVGSVDLPGTRYAAQCNTNGFRVEVITTKNIMRFVPTLLRAFKKNTGKIPQRMFYFRDGVSEGQYEHIIDQELNDIKAACRSIDPKYCPVITVTVCTKRHHARFFPVDKIASDRNGNVVPGTLIDRDITHPTEYDFFLCSHGAIQGTSRATRYTVIHDENKMPVDKFQALVYNFCYTYMRATCSVSLMPPVYYAHLASARARAHEIGGGESDQQTTTSGGQSGSQMPTEFEDLKPLGKALEDQMWYI